jgi:hypothetical protein
MVNELHIQNKTMKPLAIALSGTEGNRDDGGDLTDVECKPI